jgi:phosphatidylethanolamine-binding protein (PEBP) family uncharacterized protein
MELFYNSKQILNNSFLTPSETKIEPKIKILLDTDKLYLLIMYDPDAINGTFDHWVITNILNQNIKTGVSLLPYIGPNPPPKTGNHRYIFELYEQKEKQISVDIKERNYTINMLRKILKVDKPLFKFKFISKNEIGGKKNHTNKKKNKKYNKTKKY